MTLAVVVATGLVKEPAGAGEPWPPATLRRLLDQLVTLNVSDVRVVARGLAAPELRNGLGPGTEVLESDGPVGDLRLLAGLAQAAEGALVILPAETVASDELLVRLAGTGRDLATAVTAPAGHGSPVRTGGGRIISAGTGFHQVTDPNGVFCGPLRVGPARRRTFARVAERLAALLETPGALPGALPGRAGAPAEAPADLTALLLAGLVREGVTVTPLGAPPLVCRQAYDDAAVRSALAEADAVDEDKVRLDAAVKSNDGFFTTYAVSTYSRYIARWAARRGLTPNMVTSISMGIAVLAAVWFAAGTRAGMVVGAVLYYFAFVFDCVDGQLARYTRQFSTFGAWLDATFDRAKEYTVFAGLAVGSTAAAAGSSVHAGDVWPLAVAAMALQTGRHMIDFSFGVANRHRKAAAPPPVTPMTAAQDGLPAAGRPGDTSAQRPGGIGGLLATLSRHSQRGVAYWAKKIIVLPIGERFALVCVTAALFNAKVTFIALLAWGTVAAAYTLTGRVLRSLAR